jgi:SpoVK/Ycf46/Vps4 family AAA+-type ATPase
MKMTEGYSCADLQFIVKEAAMAPIREMPTEALMTMKDTTEIRPISLSDFEKVLKENQPSVSQHTIDEFDEWRKRHGK